MLVQLRADDAETTGIVGMTGAHLMLLGDIIKFQPAVGPVHNALGAQNMTVLAGIERSEDLLQLGLGKDPGSFLAPGGEHIVRVVMMVMVALAVRIVTLLTIMMMVVMFVLLVVVVMFMLVLFMLIMVMVVMALTLGIVALLAIVMMVVMFMLLAVVMMLMLKIGRAHV